LHYIIYKDAVGATSSVRKTNKKYFSVNRDVVNLISTVVRTVIIVYNDTCIIVLGSHGIYGGIIYVY
jgi:hypothetical protein